MSPFTHLLPQARAWRINTNKKLTQFFEALEGDLIPFYDDIFFDLFPQTTRSLDLWNSQFGLLAYTLTEQQRRDRLDATWKAIGAQDPGYIQKTLQANGFDVYIHEWWEPGPLTARNPLLHLRADSGVEYNFINCGEALAQCGEPGAQCGERKPQVGYALVNLVYEIVEALAQCGEALAQCGESGAQCDNILGYVEGLKKYVIPSNSLFWPYFLYIGGRVFGDTALVDINRKSEFEELCLRICPAQQWLGMIIEYN